MADQFVAQIGKVTENLPRMAEQAAEVLPALIGAVTDSLPQLIEAFMYAFDVLVQQLPTMLPMLVQAIVTLVGSLGSAVVGMVPALMAAGLAIGLLSSVIPYWLELEVLRRLPARVFGVWMSMQPAVAAVIGLLLLSQSLSLGEWAGICCVTVASGGAARSNEE